MSSPVAFAAAPPPAAAASFTVPSRNCDLCCKPCGTSRLKRCGHPFHLSCIARNIRNELSLKCPLCTQSIQAVDLYAVLLSERHGKRLREEGLHGYVLLCAKKRLVEDLLTSDWEDSDLRDSLRPPTTATVAV